MRSTVRGKGDVHGLGGECRFLLRGGQFLSPSGERLLDCALGLADELAGGSLLVLGEVLDGAVRGREHRGIPGVVDPHLLELGAGVGYGDRCERGLDGMADGGFVDAHRGGIGRVADIGGRGPEGGR
jgi:hypothetical protein